VLICLEALYPALAREVARAGADALVNLSHDGWYGGRGGAEQHLAQVRFRAIETRRPLVRSTTTGISAVVAPDGALAATLPPGARALRTRIPAPWPGTSLYVRFGDVFSVACTAFWLAVAGRALAMRCRSRRDQGEATAPHPVGGGVAGSLPRR
jgi:apolipoprotein N-acyltransferase